MDFDDDYDIPDDLFGDFSDDDMFDDYDDDLPFNRDWDDNYISDGSDDQDYRSSSSSDESSDERSDITLPIEKYKKEIIKAVQQHQVVIVTGESGSGKSTKVPQYILDSDLNHKKLIGIIEPRKVCAVTIAKRIARERGCRLRREVGYQISFDSRWTGSTKIKVMTEGVLLNEFRSDRYICDYGVIIMDEAHERSINSDILLALLKNVSLRRKDFRIIISSSTLDEAKYLNYFNDVEILRIEGRIYPVEVIDSFNISLETIVGNYMTELRPNQGGGVLIFANGVGDILRYCSKLNEYFESMEIGDIIILPFHSGIGIDAQLKILKPLKPYQTKIVIADNTAESGLTIEGVDIVIDLGTFMANNYIPRLDIDSLYAAHISLAQAAQRRGRVGRTGPGKYHRCDLSFQEHYYPKILRQNLSDMFLNLVAMDLDPFGLNYLDRPREYMLRYAEQELRLQALIGGEGRLTPLGRLVSDTPLGLRLAKVIQVSIGKDCLFTIVCMCSMLSSDHVFLRPWKRKEIEKSIKRHRKFYDKTGDHFTLLRLYREWKLQDNQRRWCHKYFINLPMMREVDMGIEQIYMKLRRQGLSFSLTVVDDRDEIKKSFIAVYFRNLSLNSYWRFIEKIYHSLPLWCSKFSKYKPFIKGKLCLFLKAVLIDVDTYPQYFANQIMAIEPHLLDGFVEEMRMIGYPTNMTDNFLFNLGIGYTLHDAIYFSG